MKSSPSPLLTRPQAHTHLVDKEWPEVRKSSSCSREPMAHCSDRSITYSTAAAGRPGRDGLRLDGVAVLQRVVRIPGVSTTCGQTSRPSTQAKGAHRPRPALMEAPTGHGEEQSSGKGQK